MHRDPKRATDVMKSQAVHHRLAIMKKMNRLTHKAALKYDGHDKRALRKANQEFKTLVAENGGERYLHLSRGRRAKVRAALRIAKLSH